MQHTLTMRAANLVMDCSDLERLAAFWGALLEMRVTSREDKWLDLEPIHQGVPKLSFQLVPEAKSGKNRLHLDLEVPDITAAGERAWQLGATPAGPAYDSPGAGFRVWRDPEGNEFCFVARSDVA